MAPGSNGRVKIKLAMLEMAENCMTGRFFAEKQIPESKPCLRNVIMKDTL